MSLTTEKRTTSSAANRFLTVTLGKELYALCALNVREIIRPPEISPVPRSPAHLLGVINLRGKIIPVLDLRVRFGLEFTGQTERTCIVVVQTGKAPATIQHIGLMVDEAQEVLTLNDIEEPPSFGSSVESSCIRGMAKVRDSVVILLDLDRLLAEGKEEP